MEISMEMPKRFTDWIKKMPKWSQLNPAKTLLAEAYLMGKTDGMEETIRGAQSPPEKRKEASS
jgi:hypothetical protein